ncbi:hypothetical protein E4U51_002866 [Claviceps purpurea]|nr:hypothetical protein E4U51_002866 [Claviceps purpurea]
MYPDEKFTDNHSEDQILAAAVITQVCGNVDTGEAMVYPYRTPFFTIAANTWRDLGDDGSSTYLIFAVVVGEFLVLHIKTMSSSLKAKS